MQPRDLNQELVGAVKSDNLELAASLLKEGANACFWVEEKKSKVTLECDKIPLIFFANSPEMLTLLLEKGANPNTGIKFTPMSRNLLIEGLTLNPSDCIDRILETTLTTMGAFLEHPINTTNALLTHGPTLLQHLVNTSLVNRIIENTSLYQQISTLVSHKQGLISTGDINEALIKLLQYFKVFITNNNSIWKHTEARVILSLIKASTNLLEKPDGHVHSPFSFAKDSMKSETVTEEMIKNNFILAEDILHSRDKQIINVSENKFITFLAFAQKFQFLLLAWKLDEKSDLNILPADIIFFIMKPLLDLELQEEDIQRYSNYCKENDSLASKMLEFKKTYNSQKQSTFSNKNFLQDNSHLSHSSLFARATEYAEHRNPTGLVASALETANQPHQNIETNTAEIEINVAEVKTNIAEVEISVAEKNNLSCCSIFNNPGCLIYRTSNLASNENRELHINFNKL